MANETQDAESGSPERASAEESNIEQLKLQLEKQRQTFSVCHFETQEADHLSFCQ